MTDPITVTTETYLLFMPARCAVPPEFWKRVKAKAREQGCADEMEAEYRLNKGRVWEERVTNPWWGASEEMELEQAMFRRWVLRLFGEPALWPWQRGWTKSALAKYLNEP
jgi:hypothetical protein